MGVAEGGGRIQQKGYGVIIGSLKNDEIHNSEHHESAGRKARSEADHKSDLPLRQFPVSLTSAIVCTADRKDKAI